MQDQHFIRDWTENHTVFTTKSRDGERPRRGHGKKLAPHPDPMNLPYRLGGPRWLVAATAAATDESLRILAKIGSTCPTTP